MTLEQIIEAAEKAKREIDVKVASRDFGHLQETTITYIDADAFIEALREGEQR